MRNLAILMSLGLIFLFGCAASSSVETGPVLEIVPGTTSDVMLVGGTANAEILRFDIVNRSGRDVSLQSLTSSLQQTNGFLVEEGTFTDVKFTDGAFSTEMGPMEFTAASGDLRFTDELLLRAFETRTFVLRADVGANAGSFLMVVGELGNLLTDAVYADTGENVEMAQIVHNQMMARVVTVIAPPSVGTTALVATFTPEQRFLNPSDSVWQRLGTLSLDSFGGTSIFSSAEVMGANLGFLSMMTLAEARNGIVVGTLETPIAACGCGTVRLVNPVHISEGEHIVYEVLGRVSPGSLGAMTFGVSQSGFSATAADGGSFQTFVSAPDESMFHIASTNPVVVPQALSTTTLVNGIDQDLFRFQVSSSTGENVLFVGSLTFRFGGIGSGSLTNLHMRLGSTDLAPSQYRILVTSTGEEISSTDVIDGVSGQYTIVFTADGLRVFGSGVILTLEGTPSDFESGEATSVIFGDRMFSTISPSAFGAMSANGQIEYTDGRAAYTAVDPIVWRTAESSWYTGSWGIDNLNDGAILSSL
ncbi:MAG: hypothetical protein WCK01_01055 [Candidatus Uhrbacteria bacterium]